MSFHVCTIPMPMIHDIIGTYIYCTINIQIHILYVSCRCHNDLQTVETVVGMWTRKSTYIEELLYKPYLICTYIVTTIVLNSRD